MQANSHLLAHHGLSTLCTRARWQPYASIQPSSMWTPSGTYLHTPASSSSNVSTPAPALHNSIYKSDLTKPLPPHSNSHIPSQPLKDIRDVHKHKYVTGLVSEYLGDFYFLRHSFLPDAAIRSLCEIWNPHDIPTVFLTQVCVMTPSTSMHSILPLMDHLIPLFSLHSPNNYPHCQSHCHTYQAHLPPLTFPQHFAFHHDLKPENFIFTDGWMFSQDGYP